jgi:hypothetical protein
VTRPIKDPSRPAGRLLQAVLLVADASENGNSRVKLGGGRGLREGCGPAVAHGRADWRRRGVEHKP